MITLTSLSKIYRTDEIETVALENVNLTVERGEFLSIMGPSGCGKSTLLNIMGLLDAPTTGTIEINGTHTEGMKDKQLAAFRNKTLGFVFQSFHLINSLNVMEKFHDFRSHLRIQITGRLIGKNDLRIANDCTCYCHTLALTTGKLRREVIHTMT